MKETEIGATLLAIIVIFAFAFAFFFEKVYEAGYRQACKDYAAGKVKYNLVQKK